MLLVVLHVSLNLVVLFLPVVSVVLWIGDLNYRISDLDVDDVKELISKKEFETLHTFDQVIVAFFRCYFSSLKSPFDTYTLLCFPAQEADQ